MESNSQHKVAQKIVGRRKRKPKTMREELFLQRLNETETEFTALMVEIKQRIYQQGKSINDIAKEMNVAPAHLCKVLKGQHMCQADYLLILCKVAGTGLQLADIRTVKVYSPNNTTNEHATTT